MNGGKLRLGLVTDFFPPLAFGGAEYSTQRLATALAEAGHTIHLFTNAYSGWLPPAIPGVTLHIYNAFQREPQTVSRALLTLLLPGWDKRFAAFLATAAKDLNLDLLHAQNMPVWWSARHAADTLGLPCAASSRDPRGVCAEGWCFHTHDDPPPCALPAMLRCHARRQQNLHVSLKSRAFLWADFALRLRAHRKGQAALLRMDGVHFVGENLRRMHLSRLPLPPDRTAMIHTLPPPEKPMDPVQPEGLPTEAVTNGFALFLGRLTPGKGADILIQAFRALPGNPWLVMAGLNESGIQPQDRLLLLPHQPPSAVRWLMEHANYLVMPAVWPEPYSRVILEAMAAGLPVLASNAGGNIEQITHEKNGLLVPRGDMQALSQAMHRLNTDPALLARLKQGAAQTPGDDPSHLLTQYEAFYQRMLHAR